MDLVTPMAPEEILPLEVWGLILDNLRSPSDLINCNKVCKAWKKLLELKKTTFLMPQVFSILYKYLKTVEDYEVHEEDENEEEKEETITTILKMRLVSHGWKESVDRHHQNHPGLNEIGFKALTEYDDYKDNYKPFPLLPYHFGRETKSIAKLESFLVKGFSPESNPFITRYVQYCDYLYDNRYQSRLETAFKNMLEAFGSQIWTCELLLRTNANKSNLVGSYLRLMPNLRSLQLRFFLNNNSEKELNMLLQSEPPPRLEHLTKLEMNNVPFPLAVGVLENNGHLQKLSFKNEDGYNAELLPDYIANLQLPSLKQLAFPHFEKKFLNFPAVSWPIKRLDLSVGEAKLKDVFQDVSSTLSNTLEHFVLTCYNISEKNEELKQIRLELPKLKMFQLETFELETIDFLQGCPDLQELQLAFRVPLKDKEDDEVPSSSSTTNEDEEDNSVIKFKDCISSMDQSNIWRILNKLQFIKTKTNVKEAIAYLLGGRTVKLYPNEFRKFTRRQFEKHSNARR
ncbi:unnamed protein product [Orchesella dallaii]|uniref:F-box domain-containing protein n=1 Tax=Orchesella dallaii TaxID=48710 RepID=A0ABP1RZA5_9HEXA